MIQGGEDVSSGQDIPPSSTSNGIQQQVNPAVSQQSQTACPTTLPATHRQRIVVSQTYGGGAAVTSAAPSHATAAGAAGTTVNPSGDPSLQHCFISGVPLSSQLQNVAITTQVTGQLREGIVPTVGTDATSTDASYSLSSSQNLARILAAAAPNCSVRTGSMTSQNLIVGVSAPITQSEQQLVNSPTVPVSVPNLSLPAAVCCGVITLPVTTTSVVQKPTINGGRQDNLSLRLAPGLTSTMGQQTLILGSTSSGVQPDDVTRVHSYSLASASSSLVPPSNLQQVHDVSPNRVVMPVVPSQKGLLSSNHTLPLCSPLKRNLEASASSVNSFGSAVTNIVSPVNNLVPFSTFVSTSSPLNTVVGSGIPNFSSHRPKKVKLEMIAPPDEGTAAKRRKISDYRSTQLKANRIRYHEELIELFFLQRGYNMIDYWGFRKKPVASLLSFLRANLLDSDDEEEQKLLSETKLPVPSVLPAGVSSTPTSDQGNLSSEQLTQLSKSGVSSSSSSQVQSHSSHLPLQGPATPSLPESPAVTSQTPASTTVSDKSLKQTPAVTSKMLRQHSISAVYDSSIGSQEEIVERAKQEAYVMQRISELRKEGLWSMKRLPKVQEPPRTKAQWDYLLEEMVWLATDFAQERKWKKAAAKKCARMVLKFHQEKELKAEKAEKEEQMKLRKIASQVAKEVKQFWSNIEKLVEYKQNTLLEEKRKKFLDLHLNFIVDQTEKYSSWLAQGMNRGLHESAGTSRASSPTHMSPPESPQRPQSGMSLDNEFLPDNSESDDEETIEKEEENVCEMEHEEEIKLLREESEVPLEELLESLPPEMFEKPASFPESETSSEEKANSSYFDTVFTKEDVMMGKVDVLGDSSVEDDEFTVTSEEEDDESTIQEQEKRENAVDYSQELQDLQTESELSIEDLYLKYADAYASDFEIPDSDESMMDDKESVSSGEDDKGNEDKENIEDAEVSMDTRESKSNITDDSMQEFMSREEASFEEEVDPEKSPSKEITDIAATAERFQPKGNTLSTTQVCTKVPFLLQHQLREYQHIGLDWLNAMYDKKLNGILADEMGLGKTIQTISLLAHLACEKGIWGPHLIVVPTSVMLNWEMEFKKWCPGFKILTYYGTPKERKQKRMGWTKPNAFHVCITSYKLVIQDHHSFRRKKWKYFILDEAQNIKNFRSQRWQMLLNFQSSHRLLLTGTPLQNSLVELWSLMHFLMPSIFQSHREFKEWFVNPVSGMIEGNVEYNEGLIKRLHKVLRPFLLRRLKCEVEKQLPKKYEHVIMCRLSKRQRFLYDDFMAQTKTRETLATGNFMSVINVLMQLRKVCNHPNMFEVRPVVSPFMMERICFWTASLVWTALDYDPLKHVSLWALNILLADLELCLTAFAAHRIKKFQTPPRLIEEIDNQPNPPPRCPAGKIRLHVQNSQVPSTTAQTVPQSRTPSPASGVRLANAPVVTRMPAAATALTNPQRYVVMPGHHSAPSSRATSPIAAVTGHPIVSQPANEYTLQLLQQPAGSVPVAQLGKLGNQVVTSTPITVQIQQTVQGGARLSMPLGIGRLVQTSTGQHLLLTPTVSTVATDSQQIVTPAATTMAFAGANNSSVHLSSLVAPGPMVGTATVLPQVQKVATAPSVMPPIVAALSRPQNSTVATALSQIPSNKPVGRVAPLNIIPPANPPPVNPVHNAVQGLKSPVVHSLTKTSKPESTVEKRTSLFYLESLAERRVKARQEALRLLGQVNRQRCAACPIYGHDLIEAVTVTGNIKHYSKNFSWYGRGYVNCLNSPSIANRPRSHWQYTKALCEIIDTPEKCITKQLNVINRFVFIVPAVTAPCIQMHMSHPPPSKLNADRLWRERLTAELSPPCALLHPILSNVKTQFPDLRLIEYDCGKLQRLSNLLWELKTNHHRVLIFTQMTRMLDILEQFLNYHGHTYLRLDGTTKVEERQVLMETFNMDKRYFCFILSTRSGGIGVNLTGADTVIFYDSDWNPTMDAQAQDRCHRIGQTRDVHIYRLISEMTVEENILKKANQKRLLGDLAIEGGNFTTAFFKTNTLQELFGIDNKEPVIVEPVKIEETSVASEESSSGQPDTPEKFSQAQLEQALGMAEEELDLQAAKTAHAEAAAELAEFDESIPIDSDSRDNEEKSPAEEELEKLMDQLTPVEKYALQFLESLQDPVSEEQFELAKEEIEAQKKDWELERLKALKEEEERRSGLLSGDEDPLLSYGRTEAYDQVYVSINGQEEMPIWAPPTPPQDENDLYIDYSFGFCYEQSLMPESQLPPIYIKKEAKRLKVDTVIAATATTRKQKVRKDDSVYIPRSLFDRPTAAILKMRREAKMQKFKGLVPGSAAIPKQSFLPLRQAPSLASQQLQSHPMAMSKQPVDAHQDSPEWLVHEDWAILQVVQYLQGLSLSLAIVTPAHFANWDLVADSVNAVSRIYRSAKQCKNHYENVIVPREEGKILFDPSLKKQKKTKGLYKTKTNRPMRTSHLYQQDNNCSFTRLYSTRCVAVGEVAKRHSPSIKSYTQSGKNPKHASVLADSGINYDQPLTPMQVAVNRAERIAREKQRTQAAAAAQTAAQVAAEQQQLAAKIQQQQQQQHVQQVGMPVAGTATIAPHQAQAVIASLTQAPQLQAAQLGKAALPVGTVTTVSLSKPIGGGIMVNAAGASSTPGTFATISKALSGVSTVSAQGIAQNAAACGLTSASMRNQRSHVTSGGSTTTVAVQETVTAVASLNRGLTTSSPANVSTSTTPAVVSVASLTAVQLQTAASQRISASNLAAVTNVSSALSQAGTQVSATRNMTPSQLQVIRQTAILRQQRMQEQQMKQHHQLKRLQVASATQQVAQQAGGNKVSVSSNSTLSAAAAVAAVAQQRAVQQQQAVKQAIGRTVTEVEVAQLLKRHQLSQQKQAVAAAQLQTAQILAQAQLQQVQQQQQQQVQASIAGTVQTPVATLVKTVSAPTSLGASPSVAIPVSAVTMAGVNINVSLPQAKPGSTPTKGITSAAATATVTPQQLRQLQLHQQLLQQRKIQKVTSVAQLAKVAGKGGVGTAATLPSTTVQILQHGSQTAGNQQAKSIQAAPGGMTVQQIQQVIKQVLPPHIPVQVSSAQVTSGNSVTTTLSQNQLLSHHAVLQAAAAAAPVASVAGIKTTVAAGHIASSVAAATSSAQSLTSPTPSSGAAASVQTRIIPVCQASPASSAQSNLKQTIQVVTASPNVTASIQGQSALRGEPGIMTSGVKTQTTLPSTTLTSAMLKGSPTVVVSGQQAAAAIIQQVASSNASLLPSQAVTLAVRAAAAQAPGQSQVQIQVQQSPTSLMAAPQSQIQQLSQNPATINLSQSIPIQGSTQVTSVLSPATGISALPSTMTIESPMTSPTHVVMSTTPQAGSSIVMPPGLTSSATTTAQVVQAALQAAKQQQQAAQQQAAQQQRASPYTMRLRNPPKQ